MGFVKEFVCINGHSRDVFEHKRDDLYCTEHSACVTCEICNETMTGILSGGHALLYFEEGRPREIANLDVGEGPVRVTSHAQHKEAMKRRGVELAGARKGQKGSWV